MTASSSPTNNTENSGKTKASPSGTEVTRMEANRQGAEDAVLSEQQASDENKRLAEHMHSILKDSRQEAETLRHKLTLTYWIIVILSVLMFLVGLGLISTPLWGAFVMVDASGSAGQTGLALEPFIAAGIGIVDLIGLFLFNPIARVQKLMGDMSQLTVVFDSFQVQVALRLLETDSKKRATMGAAADHVEAAAEDTLRLIEERYEKWLTEELRQSVIRGDSSDGADGS